MQLAPPFAAYPYVQYKDDDNIAAFFEAYNQVAQQYVDYFDNYNLAVYTAENINSGLLDWTAEGIYGIARPVLPDGQITSVGAYNTLPYDKQAYNQRIITSSVNYSFVNDDIFRRVITWNFYKGDGAQFNIRWLKNRILRFINGANGTDTGHGTTYQIGITFGAGNLININILTGAGTVAGGSVYTDTAYNTPTYATLGTNPPVLTPVPFADIFKIAVDSGVLQLPFQHTYSVNIG